MSKVRGVRLRVGDRVLIDGKHYRVIAVADNRALATPIKKRRLPNRVIEPARTSDVVRFVPRQPEPTTSPTAQEAALALEALAAKQHNLERQRKAPLLPSSPDAAITPYQDAGRWSRRSVPGGRPESQRRKH